MGLDWSVVFFCFVSLHNSELTVVPALPPYPLPHIFSVRKFPMLNS